MEDTRGCEVVDDELDDLRDREDEDEVEEELEGVGGFVDDRAALGHGWAA